MAFVKKIVQGIILFLVISSIPVFAEESISYTNKNGVTLSEKEYQIVEEFYGNGFFDNMTVDDYEWIKDLNIDTSNVEMKTVYYYDYQDDYIQPYGTVVSTPTKKLSIIKSCSWICTLITRLEWLQDPDVRSYDVIGVRLENVNFFNKEFETRIDSSNGTEYFIANKIFDYGLGASVKLPSNATNISIQQKFCTRLGGTIYASYQHATTDISLNTSMNYSIIENGLGKVFGFYNDAVGKFDGMQGVEI